jgi:hypothetical protein
MYQGYGKRGNDMKFVYLVMCGEGYGRVIRVVTRESTATLMVNMYAVSNYDIDVCRADCPPLDFDGALMRYGWADRVWWQKEVLYD